MNTETVTDHPLSMAAIESLTDFVVCGDWHGQTGWALRALRSMNSSHPNDKIIFHVGDFGVYRDQSARKFFRKLQRNLELTERFLLVTLGNHEDYDYLKKAVKHPTIPFLSFFSDSPRILFFSRGARWESNGLQVMSFGGANSINVTSLVEGVSWWEAEQITDDEISWASLGGEVDILISHDMPANIGYFNEADVDSTIQEWGAEEYAYSVGSRVQLRKLVDIVKPSYMFHGHYHIRKTILRKLENKDGENWLMRIDTLNREDSKQGNVLSFNLETGTVTNVFVS